MKEDKVVLVDTPGSQCHFLMTNLRKLDFFSLQYALKNAM